jgi:outer membrane protein TolC
MKNILVLFPLTLALFQLGQASVQSVKSEAPNPALRFDLQECIELALHNSNRMKISRESVEMAMALHRQALSSWWPQISGSILGTRMDEDPNFLFPALSVRSEHRSLHRAGMASSIHHKAGPVWKKPPTGHAANPSRSRS